jgi:CBS domain-containing protein
MNVKASEIMARNVITISADASANEAVRLMLQHKISGLPVVDAAGELAGIVTEGDFLRRAETGTETQRPRWLQVLTGTGKLADEYVRSHGRKVSAIMTGDVVAVGEDATLADIVKAMEKWRIKRVPVIRDRKVVGLVSRSDLLRAFARTVSAAGTTTNAPESDLKLRDLVQAEFDRLPWSMRNMISLTVKNAVVDLQGVVFDVREREALRVAAENIPGVKAVHDHLVWIEPVSGTALDLSASA